MLSSRKRQGTSITPPAAVAPMVMENAPAGRRWSPGHWHFEAYLDLHVETLISVGDCVSDKGNCVWPLGERSYLLLSFIFSFEERFFFFGCCCFGLVWCPGWQHTRSWLILLADKGVCQGAGCLLSVYILYVCVCVSVCVSERVRD